MRSGQAAKAFETATSADIPAKDADAVAQMVKRGLVVTKMDAKAQDELYAQIGKLAASMRGDQVPADMYDAAKAALDAYRSKK